MNTPYDWQEAIGHRAEYIEARLATAVPVVNISLDEGIVSATYRRQTSKLYEIYDRLMYAAIGQQSDIESLRVAAIDFAHREGFQRSEDDVTIQRIVTAMSQPIKDAFANFSVAPWIGKCLFIEVGASPELDRYYCLEYDGDYTTDHEHSCLAGTSKLAAELLQSLSKIKKNKLSPSDSIPHLKELLSSAIKSEEHGGENPLDELKFEATLLLRRGNGDRRFERLVQPED